jgi:hypothetical protein
LFELFWEVELTYRYILPSSSLQGLSSLILFPLLATGVIDTGGKLQPFAAGIVDRVANLPPVSTTLAKLVAKLAANVIDTGDAP